LRCEKPSATNTLALQEIESIFKSGLKEEADFETLAGLYSLAKLPEQAKWIKSIEPAREQQFLRSNFVAGLKNLPVRVTLQ